MPHKIVFAADHAGFALKHLLIGELANLPGDWQPLDLGTHDEASVDYPDFGAAAAQAVAAGEALFGVIVCGSGIGISIAANRFPGVRAALCQNADMARLAREHNDANILALGARFIDERTAKDTLRIFLATPFAGGRHQARVEKLG